MVRAGVIMVIFVFCIASIACAAPMGVEKSSAGPDVQKTQAIVDAGNKICPVGGEKVDGQSTYIYNGKRYNLCCPMCAGVFKKDPVKYSAIADKETAGKK